ncbi:hypothetical protein BDQ17DRAFT_1331635 [Cyathus striatus]|nr:hypothetical protein BDQ17DRAFT_1331635 [Cyathus striatus]
MTKELPSPTSKDCPKWNGDGEKVKDWLRSLEIMYNHFEATDGEKRVKHALGCIAKAILVTKLKCLLKQKVQIGRSSNKDYYRSMIQRRGNVMAVKTADVTKRSREDPYKLSDVIEAADQVMNATPIGGISLLADENKKSDTGNSRGIVKKEIIDSSLVEEAKIVAAQTSKELETFKAEMKGWMQQMQSTVTMAINRPAPPPVNQYRGPNNGFSNNTTNCKVKAEDLRNGIIRDTPHGLVMAASGIKIPRVEGRTIKQEIDRILQMKEPEIRAMEAGNGRATMTQSTAPINEPPEHMKAMLLQYRHWIDSNAASTSQYIQTRTGYETNPETDF